MPLEASDIIAIQQLYAAYNVAADHGDGKAFGGCFTADGVFDTGTMRAEGADALAGFANGIPAAAPGCRHIATNVLVEGDGDLATGQANTRKKVADTDEGPRPDSSMETLGKLKTVFAVKGSVTAGNSSQMSDGAAAVILMSEAAMKKYNVKPIARFVGFAVAGVPPEIMGIGPIKAIPKVLSQSGIRKEDLDWIELNEAFAAQSLAVIKDLGLDPATVGRTQWGISPHTDYGSFTLLSQDALGGLERGTLAYAPDEG